MKVRTSVASTVCLAVLAAVVIAGTVARSDAPPSRPGVEYVSTYVWQMNEEGFGGFSGLEISPDGRHFRALSDRARLYWGRLTRSPAGRITEVSPQGRTRLRDSQGDLLPPGRVGDSEGLAGGTVGPFYVSFEGLDRLAKYATPDSSALRIPEPPFTPPRNAGYEALARAPDGVLWTLPEDPNAARFPVWTWDGAAWAQPYSLSHDPDWLATGADFDDQGRFYLLERKFLGIRGFASRVRRFNVNADGPDEGSVLFESTPRRFDNLEGISVWRDNEGLRITMISDDNFFFIQRTEFVEYRLTGDAL